MTKLTGISKGTGSKRFQGELKKVFGKHRNALLSAVQAADIDEYLNALKAFYREYGKLGGGIFEPAPSPTIDPSFCVDRSGDESGYVTASS